MFVLLMGQIFYLFSICVLYYVLVPQQNNSDYPSFLIPLVVISKHVQREKGRDLTQSYEKSPSSTESPKSKVMKQKLTKILHIHCGPT